MNTLVINHQNIKLKKYIFIKLLFDSKGRIIINIFEYENKKNNNQYFFNIKNK